MELMQKCSKDDDAIGVEDLERWPSDSKAVGFLSRKNVRRIRERIDRGGYVRLLLDHLTYSSILSSYLHGGWKS